jgi:hypothetical protein
MVDIPPGGAIFVALPEGETVAAITSLKTLQNTVREAVRKVTITDIHTHLFPVSHGKLLLWGADELLTYHYLVSELFTVAPRSLTHQEFWQMPKSRQAQLVWEHVFLKHGPISEAARGVMTCFNMLGLDIGKRDLASIRKWFAAQKPENYLEKVFKLSGLDYAVMTNNPFIAEEAGYWNQELPGNNRLKTALRIDTLVLNWPAAAKEMSAQGYRCPATLNAKGVAVARTFLADWIEKIKPLYMAASLGPDFAYPDNSDSTKILDQIVLPTARDLNVPLAMMIGVRKAVMPALGDGGDGVGVADPASVMHLCQKYPDVKFLVTMLSRVNQHELCILGRKFPNLHLFGCWWFCNNPSIIEELTRMRFELLGTAVTCQHSDARVLDQLIYKWAHTRRIVAEVLCDKYTLAWQAGWRPTRDEIARDARAIFGGSFHEFLNK